MHCDRRLFKISKQFLEVEQFHGRSERLVLQELWAHFNLIAMTRTFTNRDAALCATAQESPDQPLPQANFKHSLHTLARHLEALMLRHSQFLHSTLATIAEYVGVDLAALVVLQLVVGLGHGAPPQMIGHP